MKNKMTTLMLLAGLTLVGVPEVSYGQDNLDELLGIKEKDTKKEDKKDEKQPIKLDSKVKDAVKSQADASKSFKSVVADMKHVAKEINEKQDTSVKTQRVQKDILNRLDTLIQAMRPKKSKPQKQKGEKQEQGSGEQEGQQPGQQPGQPSQSPPDQEFQAGSGSVQDHKEGGALKSERVQWGNLPQRLRDELLEGKNEKGSNLYRWLTDKYFKALAQEGTKK